MDFIVYSFLPDHLHCTAVIMFVFNFHVAHSNLVQSKVVVVEETKKTRLVLTALSKSIEMNCTTVCVQAYTNRLARTLVQMKYY